MAGMRRKNMKNVELFYDKSVEKEWTRMDRHPLEYEITKKYINRFITKKSNILDIGGGPGKYAFYLKNKGHSVSLLDLSQENINFAKEKAKEYKMELDEYKQANVLDLSFIKNESFDIVLCLGPLYHIIDNEQQAKAINECLRVLKPNGFIFITFITIFAQAISLINSCPEKIVEWRSYFEQVIETGINKGDVDTGFTDSFFFDPNKIESFMSKFPLEKLIISGVEGLFAQSEDKLKTLDKEILEEWINFSYKYASHPSILGSCQHILYIGKKI